MQGFHQALSQSLHTGFIDLSFPSVKEFQPQLLLNDKEQGKKVLSTLHKELRECEEFWFSVAFVTKGGVASIIAALEELEQRKIRGSILVSQYLNFTQPEALRTLLRFKNIELRIATKGEFHAKGYLFRKDTSFHLIIGSSNLTDSALCVNKEWNLKVSASIGSSIVTETFVEFNREFARATIVTEDFIKAYEKIYEQQKQSFAQRRLQVIESSLETVSPNQMQQEALKNLAALRAERVSKALLISATGTGKTYLSAFDVKAFNPRRFLFIVHRENIARAAKRSFKRIFGTTRTMGVFTGSEKDLNSDFIFCTIQSLALDKNLEQFAQITFDYVVIDETHRAGAPTYQKVLSKIKPRFLLGMTATPERTDGFDIFKQFDHKIAYEIRLHRALEEQMLANFHYYGVTDITVNDQVVEEEAAFNMLVANERVMHIIQKAKFYGCDNGNVRGLVFCRSVEEAFTLSLAFNDYGYKTKALSGANSEGERETAIKLLESQDLNEKLDYIFTVDIFNEGVDIPKVNQVIMLRPTQSAIIFVQQLGRGLRKADDKEHLTVIDFIGNYSNNYLVPIALYGDTSYNKDQLRKLVAGGSNLIPGASTVNFDKIAKERIFQAINNAQLTNKKDLDKEYALLKFKIGRIPMMMDFIDHGSRDPYQYVDYAGSYYEYVRAKEPMNVAMLDPFQIKLLKLFSIEVADAKRIEDIYVLSALLYRPDCHVSLLKETIKEKYDIEVLDSTINSCIRSINLEFVKQPEALVRHDAGFIRREKAFDTALENSTFKLFLTDLLQSAESIFDRKFKRGRYFDGFMLYEKYTRRNVLRILNWKENIPGQNVGGYIVHKEKTSCPIFVTYKKHESISDSIKYEDSFLSPVKFKMISKQRRTLNSPEILLMKENPVTVRFPLFIKKDDGEGAEFYYMGDVSPLGEEFEQSRMSDGKGKEVNVVEVFFAMKHEVESEIYEYIVS